MKPIKLILLMFPLMFYGCNREESVSSETLLIYPNHENNVNPCCFDFKWSSPFSGNFQFSVSRDESFNTLIIDTLLNSKSISFLNSFEPNKKYYWRIKRGKIERTSSFTIKDVLSGIDKNYTDATIHRWVENMGMPKSNDTTFTDTIQLSRSGDSVLFDYADDNIHRTLFYSQQAYADIIRYKSTVYFLSTGCDVVVNYTNDSIKIYNFHGGIGHGTRWDIRMKK